MWCVVNKKSSLLSPAAAYTDTTLSYLVTPLFTGMLLAMQYCSLTFRASKESQGSGSASTGEEIHRQADVKGGDGWQKLEGHMKQSGRGLGSSRFRF